MDRPTADTPDIESGAGSPPVDDSNASQGGADEGRNTPGQADERSGSPDSEGTGGQDRETNEHFKHVRLTEKLSKKLEELEGKLADRDGAKGGQSPAQPRLSEEEQWAELERQTGYTRDEIQSQAKLVALMTQKDRERYEESIAKIERKENEIRLRTEFPDFGEFSEEVNKSLDKMSPAMQKNIEAMRTLFYQARGKALPHILEKARADGMRRGQEDKEVIRDQSLEHPKSKPAGNSGRKPQLTERQREIAKKLRVSDEGYVNQIGTTRNKARRV